jgi:hypothetical protein
MNRPTRREALATLGGVALAVQVGAAPAPPPKPESITCTLRKEEDSSKLAYEPGALVATITSKSGFGGATIDTNGFKAPPKLVLRFPGLRSMESFMIDDGTVALGGSLGFEGASSLHLYDAKGKEVKEAKDATYQLEVRRPGKAILIEVMLTYPGEAKDGRKWKVDWIDAFR